MDKVLVTTPRIGSSMKNGEVRKHRRQERERLYDDLPSHSSMKPKSRRWDDRKSLNEYLNPLIRFLQKSCNRPWNNVYSEICANMDRRSAVKDHIFQHLFDYVKVKPVFKDGKPYEFGYSGLYPLYKNGFTFYVDKNGILNEPKNRPPPWKEKAEESSSLIKTDDSSIFFIKRESDNVWFKATAVSWDDQCNYMQFSLTKNIDWVDKLLGSKRKILLKTLSKKEKKKLFG